MKERKRAQESDRRANRGKECGRRVHPIPAAALPHTTHTQHPAAETYGWQLASQWCDCSCYTHYATKSKQFRMADCRLCHRTRKDEVADYPISGSNDELRNSPHDLTADGRVLDRQRVCRVAIAWCTINHDFEWHTEPTDVRKVVGGRG